MNLELALELIASKTKKASKRNKNQIILDIARAEGIKSMERQTLYAMVNFEVLKDKGVKIDLTKQKDIKTFMTELITTKNSVDQSISDAKSNVSFNNWSKKMKHSERLTKSHNGKNITIK